VPLLYIGWAATLGAVGSLAMIMRFIARAGVNNGWHTPPTPAPDDFGLLRAVTVVDSLTVAGAVRRRLVHAGIRATVAIGTDGRVRVLVFADKLDQARQITASPPR
jgi:hypothetical protein